MVIILQLPLCLYELQGFVVCVDDRFLPQNVTLPFSTCLHNGIHLFVIGGIISYYFKSVYFYISLDAPVE